MPRIGVTGHVMLANGTAELVYRCLLDELRRHAAAGLHGVTCLADGADQLFARAVLALNGTYEVIIPALDYRRQKVEWHNRAAFDELLGHACAVTYLPFKHSSRRAFMTASEEVLNRCDLLLAVWDGTPSRTLGDTADVVRVAEARGLPVTIVWPTGARRSDRSR